MFVRWAPIRPSNCSCSVSSSASFSRNTLLSGFAVAIIVPAKGPCASTKEEISFVVGSRERYKSSTDAVLGRGGCGVDDVVVVVVVVVVGVGVVGDGAVAGVAGGVSDVGAVVVEVVGAASVVG